MKWAEVREKLKIGEEVKVLWVDANSTHDWFDFDEEYCDHEMFVESLGHVLKADERFLVIYATRSFPCEDDKSIETYCLTLKIPTGTIKKIHSVPSWTETIELS